LYQIFDRADFINAVLIASVLQELNPAIVCDMIMKVVGKQMLKINVNLTTAWGVRAYDD
jgi:hypothetical protein